MRWVQRDQLHGEIGAVPAVGYEADWHRQPNAGSRGVAHPNRTARPPGVVQLVAALPGKGRCVIAWSGPEPGILKSDAARGAIGGGSHHQGRRWTQPTSGRCGC